MPCDRLIKPLTEEKKLSIRLKLEDSHEGLVATISQRNDAGKGDRAQPTIFRVDTKDEAKQRAKALAQNPGV